METIRNYLEAMFASMPNTSEVKKAKDELLQMMEDKYNEMIATGVNENTAVGTVISEFGNLDELAEDLGLTKEVEKVHEREQEQPRRFVNSKEIQEYLSSEAKAAWMIGLGVFLCITSAMYPALTDSIKAVSENLGIAGLFISIAIAVGLFVYTGVSRKEWAFLKKEPCQIDITTADYVKNQKIAFSHTKALCYTIGVSLCVLSIVPSMISNADYAMAFLFLLVGMGVFLLIYASVINGSFEDVLKINDRDTISGNYGKDSNVRYINDIAEFAMDVFWQTITCIYLIWSFLTFDWHITWIIWPVAGVLYKILNLALIEEEE